MTSQNEQQASDLQGHLPECEAYRNEVGGGCICHHVRACEERLREGWCVSTCGNTHYSIGYEEGLNAAREAVTALESNPELEIDWDRDYAVDPSGATRNPRVWLRDAVAAIDALREEQSSGGQGILKCSACKCDLQWLSNRLVHLGDASELCDVHMQEQPPPLPPSVGVPTTPMWPAQ